MGGNIHAIGILSFVGLIKNQKRVASAWPIGQKKIITEIVADSPRKKSGGLEQTFEWMEEHEFFCGRVAGERAW